MNNHIIVTGDNQILESNLTEQDAERLLTYYLNMDEDAYLGDPDAYSDELNSNNKKV